MTRIVLGAAAAFSLGIGIACGSAGDSVFDGGAGPTQDGGGNPESGPSSDFGNGRSDGSIDDTATDVAAVITADNAFSFGYGDATNVATFIRGQGSGGDAIFNCPVGFGPHPYVVPAAAAPKGAYLYIVAWADEQTTQGALAQFKRVGGGAVYSGDGTWEVCAVGRAYDYLGTGPDQATLNTDIGGCNQGATGATYSKGWVNTQGAITAGAIGKLAYGEANDDPAGNFPIVCQVDDAGVQGIDAVAKWMWFDPQDGTSPFVGNTGNRTQTYLIFRLPASALPAPVK